MPSPPPPLHRAASTAPPTRRPTPAGRSSTPKHPVTAVSTQPTPNAAGRPSPPACVSMAPTPQHQPLPSTPSPLSPLPSPVPAQAAADLVATAAGRDGRNHQLASKAAAACRRAGRGDRHRPGAPSAASCRRLCCPHALFPAARAHCAAAARLAARRRQQQQQCQQGRQQRRRQRQRQWAPRPRQQLCRQHGCPVGCSLLRRPAAPEHASARRARRRLPQCPSQPRPRPRR